MTKNTFSCLLTYVVSTSGMFPCIKTSHHGMFFFVCLLLWSCFSPCFWISCFIFLGYTTFIRYMKHICFLPFSSGYSYFCPSFLFHVKIFQFDIVPFAFITFVNGIKSLKVSILETYMHMFLNLLYGFLFHLEIFNLLWIKFYL